MEEWKIVLIVAAIVAAGVIYALFWNAGDLSRQEEEMQNAKCRMQNGQRLIDANALEYTRVRIFHGLNEDGTLCVGGATAVVMSCAIKDAPTVDAVPVVRCKDCKHWKPIHEHIPHMECNIFCGAYEHGYPTNADDFCSYGERRNNV